MIFVQKEGGEINKTPTLELHVENLRLHNSTWPGVDRDKGLGFSSFLCRRPSGSNLSAKNPGVGIFNLIEMMKPHRSSASKVTLLGEKVREGDILKGVRYWNGASRLIMYDYKVEEIRNGEWPLVVPKMVNYKSVKEVAWKHKRVFI